MSRLGIGVIGVGSIADMHLGAYAANPAVRLMGTYDIDADRNRAKAEAFGVARARSVLRVSPVVMLAAGLALAAGAGVIGLVQGEPFLTGNWIFPGGLPLGTPLLFDVGVFLTVLGAVLHMLLPLIGQED